MPATKTEPEVRRREKTQGVLGKLWTQTGNTLGNTGGVAEHGTGIFQDGLVLAREAIKPSIVDNRVETLQAIAEGIRDLISMGVPEDEARAYITAGF